MQIIKSSNTNVEQVLYMKKGALLIGHALHITLNLSVSNAMSEHSSICAFDCIQIQVIATNYQAEATLYIIIFSF